MNAGKNVLMESNLESMAIANPVLLVLIVPRDYIWLVNDAPMASLLHDLVLPTKVTAHCPSANLAPS
jgi:hypothetical protein